MPDNIQVTPGSGATVAADEIGGVLHQRIKAGFGADGQYSDVSAGSPLPITDANTQAILQAINGLNDTMVTLLAAIMEKMPRTTANDQAAVSVEGTATVAIASNQTLANVTTLGAINSVGGKQAIGDNINMAGCSHIYNNISVSA